MDNNDNQHSNDVGWPLSNTLDIKHACDKRPRQQADASEVLRVFVEELEKELRQQWRGELEEELRERAKRGFFKR